MDVNMYTLLFLALIMYSQLYVCIYLFIWDKRECFYLLARHNFHKEVVPGIQKINEIYCSDYYMAATFSIGCHLGLFWNNNNNNNNNNKRTPLSYFLYPESRNFRKSLNTNTCSQLPLWRHWMGPMCNVVNLLSLGI